MWGLLPIYFAGQDLDLRQIGWLTGMYPAVWGLMQLGTGPLSDRIGRRSLIVGGLLLQALALVGFTTLHGFAQWIATVVALGIGTALVYPTLIAQVGDLAGSASRASAVGRYRLWRDMGYVVGGLLAGLLTDWLDFRATLLIIALLFVGSGIVVRVFLPPPAPARAI